jgi:hypothetical protein
LYFEGFATILARLDETQYNEMTQASNSLLKPSKMYNARPIMCMCVFICR